MTIRQVFNPESKFSKQQLEWIDVPDLPPVQIYEESARTILSSNESPDLMFRWSLNPYRGCFHACTYCYARPTHQYLEFGAGTDFERKLVVKSNAADLLKVAFDKRSWRGEAIVSSGNTDCYQPLELRYELTRKCLQVCCDYANPVGIITKGAIVQRDIDVLCELQEKTAVFVTISLAFLDDALASQFEPGAPRPSTRLKALKALHAAGIPVGIALAPIIPGINDAAIPAILEKAQQHGAQSAFMTLLRLSPEVKEVFFHSLAQTHPLKFSKVQHQLAELRSGNIIEERFHKRMQGSGSRWDSIEWLFKSTCERLGMNQNEYPALFNTEQSSFKRPTRQLELL